MPDEIILLTRKEAADKLRLSLSSFDRLLAAGKGPIVTRIGGKIMIMEDHLRQWIEAAAEAPGKGRAP